MEVFKHVGVVHGQVLQKATELYCSLAFLSRTRPFMPVVHAVLDTFRRSSSDDRSITSPSVINNPEGCFSLRHDLVRVCPVREYDAGNAGRIQHRQIDSSDAPSPFVGVEPYNVV